MKIFIIVLLFFIRGLASALGAVTPSATSPEQAVQVLQTSKDLAELAAAVKVAATNPSTRPALMAFFDGPPRGEQFMVQFVQTHASVAPALLKDKASIEKWGSEHKAEANPLSDQWYAVANGTRNDLAEFFAQSKSLADFELVRHFVDNSITQIGDDHWWDDYTICQHFAEKLPADSIFIPAFLDLMEAKTVEDHRKTDRHNIAGKWLGYMAIVNTDDVYARILHGIISGKFDQVDILGALGYEGRIYCARFDHRVLPLYLAMYERLPDDKKSWVIGSLFDLPIPDSDVHADFVSDADPADFSKLLKLIYASKKMELTDNERQTMAIAEHNVLLLFTKHNMTPPTEAQLAAMPLLDAPSAPITPSPATSKASSDAKPAPASSLSSSTPLFIILGAALGMGFTLFFRRK